MTRSPVLPLLGALLALSLAACSKPSPTPDPATGSQGQPVASASDDGKPRGDGHRGDGHRGDGRRGPGARDPRKMLEMFDKDKNGKIELTELPERMRSRLADADTNKDGAITAEELQAHTDKMHKERFDHDDKNKDGFLTADEVGDKRWERTRQADANGDGKVSLAELREAMAAGKLGRPHRGDGKGPPGDKDDDNDND